MDIDFSSPVSQNMREIAELCRRTKKPVYLTENGEDKLVVMDAQTYKRREKMLELRAELLAVEEARLAGDPGYTPEEMHAEFVEMFEMIENERNSAVLK